jgi:hypothetical protein
MVAVMPGRTDHLTAADRIRAPITLVIDHDLCPVISLNCALKVHAKGSIRAPAGMICATKPPCNPSFGFALSEQKDFLLVAGNRGANPFFRIPEPQRVKRLQSHVGRLLAGTRRLAGLLVIRASASVPERDQTVAAVAVIPPTNGGDGWESNPPRTRHRRPANGFEDRGRHQPPNIPAKNPRSHAPSQMAARRGCLAATAGRPETGASQAPTD